uniref:G-protein coupled receptors family 2 profile 2 domain-containing protein n=1 Tax=Eptatretus burgeri TaxID=7764 RepID=A0A8C4R1Q2_EPTBU
MDPDTTDWGSLLSHQAAVGCRAAQAFMQYCIGANYHWVLVEGMFLHSLLLVPAFSGEAYLRHYLALGWGTPLLFIVPWIFIKLYKENTECWGHNVNLAYWWIIRCPIHLTILINFVIFVRILKILVSKLRANLVRCTDYKFRLAKSTLTLIPLLGIHEIVFTFITDEQAHGAVRFTQALPYSLPQLFPGSSCCDPLLLSHQRGAFLSPVIRRTRKFDPPSVSCEERPRPTSVGLYG